MWTFRPGYLGVTIAVIALLGGVLLGSLLNVSSHNETTTKYDYVSDITGLFDVSNEPQYIDFNPATNYTGYTNSVNDPENPTGLSYTASGLANNYRIPTRIPQESIGPSGTVNNNTNLPQADLNGKSPWSSRLNSAEYVHSNAFTSDVRDFKVASVYDWAVSVFGSLSNYSAITVTINIGAYTSPSTRAGFCATVSSDQELTRVFQFNTSPGDQTYNINPQDRTITRYVGNENTPYTYSMYDVYVCYGDADQAESYLSFGGGGSFDWNYSNDDTILSFTYTSRVTEAVQYDYLLPSAGVNNSAIKPFNTPISDYSTVWDNDTDSTQYDNVQINLLFGPSFNTGTFTLEDRNTAEYVTIGDNFIFINYGNNGTGGAGSGHWGVRLFGGTQAVDAGAFPAIMLAIINDSAGSNTRVDIYGVTQFTNYQDVQTSPSVLGTITLSNRASLDSLMFTAVETNSTIGINKALSWSVYSTRVFMDTFNAVLVDPSINLANYWPDMNSYRYAFQSFALYGDSITINGVTYPVVDQRITINNKAYVLDNFYLSFSEQGETSITFNNINKTVSLGETTDKTVSFSGYWGFTTGLYEGKTDFKKVYDWSIKLLGDNLNTIVLIALGLVAVLMLACKWLGMPFRMTDKIVLAGAGLFMVLLLVV